MIKETKMKDNPVIYLHMSPADKEALRLEGKKIGMQLSTYCRMLLLKSLEGKR